MVQPSARSCRTRVDPTTMTLRMNPPHASSTQPADASDDLIAHAGRWLSIRQIAADLGISISTAYKWSARGFPWFPRSIRLRNGDIRVRRDWYETWLELQEVHP